MTPKVNDPSILLKAFEQIRDTYKYPDESYCYYSIDCLIENLRDIDYDQWAITNLYFEMSFNNKTSEGFDLFETYIEKTIDYLEKKVWE